MSASERRDARHPDESSDGTKERTRLDANQALYFYGVARAKSWRGGRISKLEGEDVVRIRYRDLEALVRPVPYEISGHSKDLVEAHQRVIETAMRRSTILPVPYGVVFRGRRQLIRVLQEQYLILDEGLSFVDGNWELRLHVSSTAPGEVDEQLSDIAMECYSELRRYARAAVPLQREGKRLMTAAFLVDRSTWIEFVERADDLGTSHPELSFDVTGPWAPYDFVRTIV
ncbi:MAG: GvpL/GvpF family gas vesicle protein [Longimicrobiales bacterium]